MNPLNYFALSDLRFQTKQTLTRQYVTCIHHALEPSVCFPGTFTGPDLPEGLTVQEYSYPRWWIQYRFLDCHFFRKPETVHRLFYRQLDKHQK